MIKGSGEVDWQEYEATKSYSDPALRNKKERLGVAARMAQAGVTYVRTR